MSDISSSEASWLRLCHYALCERNPFRLFERITEARSAVLDHLAFPNLPSAEQAALREALETLIVLREIAERDLELNRANAQTNHSVARGLGLFGCASLTNQRLLCSLHVGLETMVALQITFSSLKSRQCCSAEPPVRNNALVRNQRKDCSESTHSFFHGIESSWYRGANLPSPFYDA